LTIPSTARSRSTKPKTERWRPIHFPTCATPFINEKQKVKKEGTENVCAHLAPTALAYLPSKSMTQYQLPGEEMRVTGQSKKYHKSHIKKEHHAGPTQK
jgi:hypothetical protein